MSANSAKVQSVIKNSFSSAIDELNNCESGSLISDLYIQVDGESGELQIYDEEENLLQKVVIFDWVNNRDESEVFYKKVCLVIKEALAGLTSENLFESSVFLKPFSVSLVDENFEVIEELLFIDDDTFRLDDPLLKDLDTDLENFINDLLSDMPK